MNLTVFQCGFAMCIVFPAQSATDLPIWCKDQSYPSVYHANNLTFFMLLACRSCLTSKQYENPQKVMNYVYLISGQLRDWSSTNYEYIHYWIVGSITN